MGALRLLYSYVVTKSNNSLTNPKMLLSIIYKSSAVSRKTAAQHLLKEKYKHVGPIMTPTFDILYGLCGILD